MSEGPEIVIGLVGAVGTDLKSVQDLIERKLREVTYTSHPIRMSELLLSCHDYKSCLKDLKDKRDFEDLRIEELMKAGDGLRKKAKRGDAAAILAVSKIREIRGSQSKGEQKPLQRTAYILNSLKHPAEIDLLREIYGEAFIAISVYTPHNIRQKSLCEKISRSRNQYHPENFVDDALKLISRDEKSVGEDYGQNVRDTFPEADVFLECGNPDNHLLDQVGRIIEILFRHPNRTPTVDEYGLFHANAAALRSADLSRQVGAVIATDEGEIVSAGCNEVPKAGGGAFWEGRDKNESDLRDFVIGHDSSARMKYEILEELFDRLKQKNWLSKEISPLDVSELVGKSIFESGAVLKDTRISSIIEFGRIVHAEMSAITEAARRGRATKDTTLYCTTFPCHMCARHIIAAGINRVVYVEPYPKSMAKDLYKGSLDVDHDASANPDAVKFRPFVGVSPKRYQNFFDMPKRKDQFGFALLWQPTEAKPRVKDFPTYIETEAIMVSELAKNRVNWGVASTEGVT